MKTIFYLLMAAVVFYIYGGKIDQVYDELQADRLTVQAYFEKIGLAGQ